LEDRIFEDAVLAGETVERFELRELLERPAVRGVAREENAARRLHAAADLGRVFGSRQRVHLLDDAAIDLFHALGAEMRIAGDEEGDGLGLARRGWRQRRGGREAREERERNRGEGAQPFENLTGARDGQRACSNGWTALEAVGGRALSGRAHRLQEVAV